MGVDFAPLLCCDLSLWTFFFFFILANHLFPGTFKAYVGLPAADHSWMSCQLDLTAVGTLDGFLVFSSEVVRKQLRSYFLSF